MLNALTENDMMTQDGHLDIYAFMRSVEIRDYMRKNKTFHPNDLACIILQSMNPYEVKLKALKILTEDERIADEERRDILDLIKLVEAALGEIYHPSRPAIFSAVDCYALCCEHSNPYGESVAENNNCMYFTDMQEFMRKYALNFNLEGDDDPLGRFDIAMVYTELPVESNNQINFDMTFFDGRPEIYAIWISDEWIKDRGFSDVYEKYFGSRIDRYSLPFLSLSRVRLQTPFMMEPMFGILDTSMDGLGCWYHFFYPTGERSMDFSYHMIDCSSGLSVFDWLTSDDGEASSEELAEVYGVRCIDRITSISTLKPGMHADIIGKAMKILSEQDAEDVRGMEISVELQDSTGAVPVAIIVDDMDKMWLYDVVRNHEHLELSATFKLDDTGTLCGKYAGDIRRIDPAAMDRLLKIKRERDEKS